MKISFYLVLLLIFCPFLLLQQNSNSYNNYVTGSTLVDDNVEMDKGKDSLDIGDTSISKNSQDSLMKSIDLNKDNKLSADELASFVTDTGMGSAFLDDKNEIENAVNNVLSTVDRNGDLQLSPDDVEKHLYNFGEILTPEEVKDWAEHSMLLPSEIIAKFVEHSVTGYDFPELIEENGLLLETELGINKAVKTRIIRGMKMKMLGMGRVSSPALLGSAEPLGCYSLLIKWKVAVPERDSGVFPVHRAVVTRYVPDTATSSDLVYDLSYDNINRIDQENEEHLYLQEHLKHMDKSQWKTVYSGPDTSFVDTGLRPGSRVIYRLSLWNAVGRSDYIVFAGYTNSEKCSTVGPSLAVGTSKMRLHSDSSGRNSNKDNDETSPHYKQHVDNDYVDIESDYAYVDGGLTLTLFGIIWAILTWIWTSVTGLYHLTQNPMLLTLLTLAGGLIRVLPMVHPEGLAFTSGIITKIADIATSTGETVTSFLPLNLLPEHIRPRQRRTSSLNAETSSNGDILGHGNSSGNGWYANGIGSSGSSGVFSRSLSNVGLRRPSSYDLNKGMSMSNGYKSNNYVNLLYIMENLRRIDVQNAKNGTSSTASTSSSSISINSLCLFCGERFQSMGLGKMGRQHNCSCRNTFHDKCGFPSNHWGPCKRAGFSGCRCLVCVGVGMTSNNNNNNHNSATRTREIEIEEGQQEEFEIQKEENKENAEGSFVAPKSPLHNSSSNLLSDSNSNANASSPVITEVNVNRAYSASDLSSEGGSPVRIAGNKGKGTPKKIKDKDVCCACTKKLMNVITIHADVAGTSAGRWLIPEEELGVVYRHRCCRRGCKRQFCGNGGGSGDTSRSCGGTIVGDHMSRLHHRWWLCKDCYCSSDCRDKAEKDKD